MTTINHTLVYFNLTAEEGGTEDSLCGSGGALGRNTVGIRDDARVGDAEGDTMEEVGGQEPPGVGDDRVHTQTDGEPHQAHEEGVYVADPLDNAT